VIGFTIAQIHRGRVLKAVFRIADAKWIAKATWEANMRTKGEFVKRIKTIFRACLVASSDLIKEFMVIVERQVTRGTKGTLSFTASVLEVADNAAKVNIAVR